MGRPQSAKIESGTFIGNLRIVSFAGIKSGRHRYECECECGNHFIAYKEHIMSGRTKSCPSCAAGKDMTGMKIGDWKIEFRTGTARSGHKLWQCRCVICGAVQNFDSRTLRKSTPPQCMNKHLTQKNSEQENNDDFFQYQFR